MLPKYGNGVAKGACFKGSSVEELKKACPVSCGHCTPVGDSPPCKDEATSGLQNKDTGKDYTCAVRTSSLLRSRAPNPTFPGPFAPCHGLPRLHRLRTCASEPFEIRFRISQCLCMQTPYACMCMYACMCACMHACTCTCMCLCMLVIRT